MSALSNGSIPADLEKSMLEIMHDVGLSTLSKNTLRRRLEAKYKMDFTPLTAEVDRLVAKLMTTPEIQRELAKIQKEKEDASARRLKRERSPSSAKKAKKDKDGAREKKERKPDDYPKGALSPYIIFVNENREKLKAKHPDMKNTELLSKMGHLWKQVSEEEKSRYQKLADEDKLRYDREMAAYVARGGAVFKRGGKKAKKANKEKDPKAPKRALTAYFFFASDYRAKHTSIPAKQQMSEAGAAWGKMSAEEKKPYEDLAAKDKKRYEAECAARSSKPSQSKGADSASSSSADSSSSDSDESD